MTPRKPVRRKKKPCAWTCEEMDDFWNTSCEKAWCFMEGTPKQNRMKFCPFCGKELEQIKP